MSAGRFRFLNRLGRTGDANLWATSPEVADAILVIGRARNAECYTNTYGSISGS